METKKEDTGNKTAFYLFAGTFIASIVVLIGYFLISVIF